MQFSKEKVADEYARPSPCHVDSAEALVVAVDHPSCATRSVHLILGWLQLPQVHGTRSSLGELPAGLHRQEGHHDATVGAERRPAEIGTHVVFPKPLECAQSISS